MMVFGRRAALAGLAAVCGAFATSPAARSDDAVDTQFESGLWFDGNRFVPRAATFVSGSTFVAAPVPGRTVSRVDAGGRYVVPAYADALSSAFALEAPEARIGFARSGVGYVRAVDAAGPAALGDDASDAERFADVVVARGPVAARRPAGGVVTGPFWRASSEADVARVWPSIALTRPDVLYVYAGAPEGLDARTLAALAGRAAAANVRLLAGCTSAQAVRDALGAGIKSLADLGSAAAHLSDADAHAAARLGATFALTAASVASPAAARAAAPFIAFLRARNVPLLFGAGAADRTALDTARLAVAGGALPAAEALRSLCVLGPQALFPARKTGTLAPGAEATFLVLEADPLADPANLERITLRFKAGRPVDVA